MKQRRKTSSYGVVVMAAAIALLSAAGLQAGQITNVTWYSGVASVAGTVIQPLADVNNDNAVGISSNSFMVLQKHYVGIGPVDLVFDVADTGGTVEYVFSEGVQNSTGLDWSGYHIELGFGTGAGFVKSGAGDGLDFDAPDYDSLVSFDGGGGFFPSTTVTEDDIIAGGGIMPDFAYAGDFIFHVD
ncbi:MAG TPA: choice-of-anchor F family protein, partial [Pontiella sp.]|nr:choice-of-anchor F family protein [Pontiella sp.]